MSDVIFVLDSGSDFEEENQLDMKHPVEVVPLNIHFGEEVYLDGVDLNKEQFYEKMASVGDLPKTSQPSPQTFYDVYKKHLSAGKEIISISLSAELSGTFQSTTIAKDMLEDDEKERVHLVDSTNVSVVVLYLLQKADELLNEGKSVQEVIQWIEEHKAKIRIYALLDTLENLKKGGRISPAQAMIGGLLNIKPLVTIDNGKVESLGKSRGRKKGLKQLEELIGSLEQYDLSTMFIAHSFATEEEARKETEQLYDTKQFGQVYYYKLGSTIGTHAGVNVLGVALMQK